jgi:hypothetical protein
MKKKIDSDYFVPGIIGKKGCDIYRSARDLQFDQRAMMKIAMRMTVMNLSDFILFLKQFCTSDAITRPHTGSYPFTKFDLSDGISNEIYTNTDSKFRRTASYFGVYRYRRGPSLSIRIGINTGLR